MEKENILVMLPTSEEERQAFYRAAPEANLQFCLPEEATRESIRQANVIFGSPAIDDVRGSENLRWLQSNAAGPDSYLQPGVLPQGCQLTNASGSYGLAISEHMLGMLLMLLKKLHTYRDSQHDHVWKSQGSVKSIWGSTVLVLGLGDIGGEFARRCQALGAYVIGVRRQDTHKPDYVDELHLIADLDTLLPRADVVAIAMPGTEETKGMFNDERLARMKEGSIILNVGRGSIIDTAALTRALQSGHLLGAGLDVTDPEPLPDDCPLWDIPSALITPPCQRIFPPAGNAHPHFAAVRRKPHPLGKRPAAFKPHGPANRLPQHGKPQRAPLRERSLCPCRFSSGPTGKKTCPPCGPFGTKWWKKGWLFPKRNR